MRIGLLADTHIPEVEKELSPRVFEALQGVDLILHAGDVTNYTVLDRLESISPVMAALGDHDYSSPTSRWREKHALKLEGRIVWLLHIRPYTSAESKLRFPYSANANDKERPDIIVFGHEHRTLIEKSDGILYMNPGSPTLLDRKLGLGTVGILELNRDKIDVRIVQL